MLHGGTSARILSTLTGYELKNIGNGKVRCGFPPQSMSRVEKMFARAHINYVIYSGEIHGGTWRISGQCFPVIY